MSIESIRMYIEKRLKEYGENPLLVIEDMAKGKDTVRLYFADFDHLNLYLQGEPCKASTERFLPTDIFCEVKKTDVWKITHGYTLAHLNKSPNSTD